MQYIVFLLCIINNPLVEKTPICNEYNDLSIINNCYRWNIDSKLKFLPFCVVQPLALWSAFTNIWAHAINGILIEIIWLFDFPRALSWTAPRPGYVNAADEGHRVWWLTDQGRGDKQALSTDLLLISAQRSLLDMAAVRVGQPPKLELAGY